MSANQMQRSLPAILDKMFEVAPDLKEHLESTKQSSLYASPEMRPYWWQQAASILNQVAMQHEKAHELMLIFSGKDTDAPQQH